MKLTEVADSTAAFVFGRFNPPTIGHKKLFDKLKTVSPVYFVFVSPTQDPKKNPLNRDQKIAIIDRQFPEAGDHIITDPSIRTIIDAMKFLETAGHKRVAMVVGSDRTKAFNDLLAKYNGQEYSFDSIDVISAGDRDPDSEGVEGVSASKAREAAQAGDYETFKTMFVGNEGLKKNIYKAVRTGMGIREDWKDVYETVVAEKSAGKEIEPDEPGYQHDILTMPQNTMVIDTPGELDWYKIGQHFPTLSQQDPHEYGQSESDMVVTFANRAEMKKFAELAKKIGLTIKSIGGSPEHPEIHDEDIRKVKGGYRLVSKKSGKNLGTYPTRAGAEKRERQVQYFKHRSEDAAGVGIVTKQNTTPDVNKKTLGKIMKALRLR